MNIDLRKGDCLEVLKQIPDKSIDTLITDPPFNLVQKMGGSIHLFRQSKQTGNKNYSEDSMSFDKEFNQLDWINAVIPKLKTGANIIIFNDWENMGDISKELRKNKIKVKSLNHWQKTNPLPSEWRRRFVSGREYFVYAIKPGEFIFNVEKVHHGDFIMGLTPNGEKKFGNHPNQKPIKLMEELIKILTTEGQTVLDCFMGSGSTGVACKNLNRNFIGIELNEKYFQIAKQRIDFAKEVVSE